MTLLPNHHCWVLATVAVLTFVHLFQMQRGEKGMPLLTLLNVFNCWTLLCLVKGLCSGTSSSSSICFNERNDEHVPIKYKNIVCHTLGMFVFATGFDFSNARFIIKNKIFCSKNINLLCFFSCFFFNLWRVITNFFYLISLPPSSYLTKLSFVSFVSLGLYDLGRKTRYIS
jgi:hypothetical protein